MFYNSAQVNQMRKALSKIDKIVLLCRNVDKTASIYSQTLGLKVLLQSPDFVELRDTNNMAIYLQQSRNASHLSKGYSPILSFNVQNFQEVHSKLLRYDLIPDGEIIELKEGKIATFLGPDGETISINSIEAEEEEFPEDRVGSESVENEQIRRILQKIKL